MLNFNHTPTYPYIKVNVELDVETFFKSFKTFIYIEVIANQDVHRMEFSYVFKC